MSDGLNNERRKIKGISMKESRNIVSLSGGKDSTAMLLMMAERGMPIDDIIFFDFGKEFPQMYHHIDKLQSYLFKHYPNLPGITKIYPSQPFEYWLYEHVKVKGKKKGTKGYGWPRMFIRWCTKLKVSSIDSWIKRQGYFGVVQYIGIALNESRNLDEYKVYPLIDFRVTESEALQYCYQKGFDWDGLYNHFSRVSCYCCPLQGLDECYALYKHFPELWQDIVEMDKKQNSVLRGLYGEKSTFRIDYSIEQLERKFYGKDIQGALL